MKKIWLSIIPVVASALLWGCDVNKSSTGGEIEWNYKKLTGGEAVLKSAEGESERYVVTLWANDKSLAEDNDYSDDNISLKLDLITKASEGGYTIESGDYTFSSSETAVNTILDSEDSALRIVTHQSYAAQYRRLVAAEVSVNSFNENYEIKGTVTDDRDNVLKFDYYGKLAFTGNDPAEAVVITFEDADLLAQTGEYSNIMWGKEKASGEDGAAVFNGMLYTEGLASFGSYFAESEWGDTWGGFAVSSNRDLADLGMDYSNQFSVYAPAATKFAVGYVFGEYGGEYGNPAIEFSEPVTIASADIANGNKTYHYCITHPRVGEDEAEEDIWVDLVATGYNGDKTETSPVRIRLAEGEQVLADWKSFDLSALGTVTKVAFTIESNDSGEYGLNVPAFFCIDNITLE